MIIEDMHETTLLNYWGKVLHAILGDDRKLNKFVCRVTLKLDLKV